MPHTHSHTGPEEPGKRSFSGFCPKGVGTTGRRLACVRADLSAKAMVGATSFLRMYHPLRGQVRSYKTHSSRTSEASPGPLYTVSKLVRTCVSR
ncbi:hypothetical protein F4W70_08020 [Pseudomonas cannabina]|nr:hypothetical protein F4W70_08020 [Pseudomonas cannabina]